MRCMQYGQSFKTADVTDAVRHAAADADGQEAMTMLNDVKARLKFNGSDRDNYVGRSSAHDRLYGQVKRALDAMAEAGELVKAGRGERGPEGGTTLLVRYWTPAKHAAAVKRSLERLAGAAAVSEAWEAVNAALAAKGYDTTGETDRPPRLGLPAWQSIIANYIS